MPLLFEAEEDKLADGCVEREALEESDALALPDGRVDWLADEEREALPLLDGCVDCDAEEDTDALALAEMPALLDDDDESDALALAEGCVDCDAEELMVVNVTSRSIGLCSFGRSLKYEDIYLCDYATVPDLEAGLQRYFACYNHERPHQSLDYAVPGKVHQGLVSLVC